MNSLFVAHVAEAILFFDGTLSYDTAAQRAADLLDANPGLVIAADSYSQGTIAADPFYHRVKDTLSKDWWTWTSPNNGVRHLVPGSRPCATCGWHHDRDLDENPDRLFNGQTVEQGYADEQADYEPG
jgi:hypothetical protein